MISILRKEDLREINLKISSSLKVITFVVVLLKKIVLYNHDLNILLVLHYYNRKFEIDWHSRINTTTASLGLNTAEMFLLPIRATISSERQVHFKRAHTHESLLFGHCIFWLLPCCFWATCNRVIHGRKTSGRSPEKEARKMWLLYFSRL